MKTQQLSHIEVINREADRCVKCALCAPVCPTYQLTHLESESPRGRIAISQALAQEQIPLTEITRLRLDHCLTCRACEAVCPAGVQYGDLIDHTQALLQEKQPIPPPPAYYLTQTNQQRWLRRVLRLYQISGLRSVMRKINFVGNARWKRYDRLLPDLPQRSQWQTFYPARGTELGQVGLFLGCVGKEFDQATLAAAIKVLTYIGYGVHIPKQQVCCGALALHAGQQTDYQNYQSNNQHAFAALPIQAIISVVTGCTAVLKEYPTPLSIPVRDINEFLLNMPWASNATLSPYPATVTLHTPCTLRNVLKQTDAPHRLLQRIPELKIISLPSDIGCCGAAGNYFLRYPEIADKLLEKTLAAIPATSNLVLTTNLGCQLQLNLGLSARKNIVSVYHPVILLAQQIQLLPD